MLPLAAIGLVAGLIGGIGKMFGRAKANRELDAIKKRNMDFAGQRKGLADALLNARMPGAVQAERNIYSNQATQLNRATQGATDASQFQLLGAVAQGQTNDAFTNLGMQEQQDYQRRYGNVDAANEVMQNAMNADYAASAAQQQNRQNTWGDISNMGFGLADFVTQMNNGEPQGGNQKPYSLKPTGTFGYQGTLPTGINNRRTPNFN